MIKVILIFTMVIFISTTINASPTFNEFIPCQNLAVASLDQCLKNDGTECWVKSKNSYESCHKGVIKSHADAIQAELRLKEITKP